MPYRIENESGTIHWCKNCPRWPTEQRSYVEQDDKPAVGVLCEECKKKQKARNCR